MSVDKINDANEQFIAAKGFWQKHHAIAASENNFLEDAWKPEIRSLREQDGRPVISTPFLGNFIRQISAINRQSQPRLHFSSDSKESKSICDAIESLITKIEESSDASFQYQLAGEHAIKTGLGFLRVSSEYEKQHSFDQVLKIEAILDPSRVFFDPNSVQYDFSDAEFCFIETKMTKKEYASRIGKSTKALEKAKISGFKSASPLSIDDDHIIILEYFYKTREPVTLRKYLNNLTNEEIITEDEELDSEEFKLIDKRKSEKIVINVCLFDGLEMHDETTFPGSLIPIIPVIGEQSFVNRTRKIKGTIRDSMDAQRVTNYATSVELELVDLAPKVPWLVEEGSIEGYEQEWKSANSRNYSYLVYKGKNGIAPPSRASVDTNTTAIKSVKEGANQAIQQIFGIFEASLGAPSNETSGVAIQSRINQADKSTYQYRDNLHRAIRMLGKVLLESVPVFYGDRDIVVTGVDGNDNIINISSELKTESFSVSIENSPTAESSRQNLNQQLASLIQAVPTIGPLVADFMIENSDLPGTDPLVARLKTLLPPEVKAIEESKMSPEQALGKAMQLQQENQQLSAQSQQLEQELSRVNEDLKMLKMSKELEFQKAQMEHDVKQQELNQSRVKMQLEFELESENLRLQQQKLKLEAKGIATDQIDVNSEL
jgi:hypothetical protein